MINYVFLVEHFVFELVLLAKIRNRKFNLILQATIDNNSSCLSSSFGIGCHLFDLYQLLSQKLDFFLLAYTTVLADKLSNMSRHFSLHIQLFPAFGVRLICDRNNLYLGLQNMIDGLTLEAVYLGANTIQQTAAAVAASHFGMADVVFRYHSILLSESKHIINFSYRNSITMLIPTSNFLNVEADKKTGQAINSIKIDYNKMVFCPKTADKFTECKSCGALLIEEDRKNHVPINNKGQFQWTCRFCKKENSSKELFFVGNNYKYPIEKNLKSKITPPIILFVIDNSGSMSQSIFSNIKYSSNPMVIAEAKKNLNYKFSQILNQSKLYQIQKKEMHKLEQSFTNLVKNTKYSEEEISKLTFLYAMIEYNLKNLVKKESIKDSRVGFIFFSDMIYVLKGAKQKEIPVYIQDGELCHEQWPYKKEVADFYDYECLFKKGRQYDKYFGDSRLKNIDISKIAINKVKGGGRTALGPALALAMGIISMHDQGSRIIVVTDSMPNFGILTTGDSDYIYKKIGCCLEENGATLSILKWSGDELNKTKEEDSFAKFRSVFRQYVQQIELNLTNCKENQGLQISMTALNNLINKEPVGMSCEVKIYCDNPKVKAQKLTFDFNDYKTLRFLNNNSKCWCTISLDKNQLQQFDFLFPITTQIVIKYSDIFSKERYIFMSYTRQQLFKPNMMKNLKNNQNSLSQTFWDQEETINIDNLNELCSLEAISKFQNRRPEDESESDQNDTKSIFRYKDIEVEKQFHNINDIAALQNLLYHETVEQEPSNEEEYEKL